MKSRNMLLWIRVAAVLAAALFGYVPQVDAAAPARQAGQLMVTQTAQASFTRTYQWAIANAAAPTLWNLMDGDQAVSRIGVRVSKTGHKDSDWTVKGVIRITNQTQSPTTLTEVVEIINPSALRAPVACPVSMPYQLQAGKSLECSYTAKLSRAFNGSSRVNVKTTGRVTGSSATTNFTFGQPTQENLATVQVSAGGQTYGPFRKNTSFDYEKWFACNNPGTLAESAAIVETGQTSQTQVKVVCFGLEYAKSMQTYRVGAGWAVKGSLNVNNTGRADMWVADVRELVGPDLEAVMNCGYSFASGPVRLAPGQTLTCTFQRSLPDQTDRWDYSRMTIQASRYNSDGTRTRIGSSDYLTDPTPLGFSE